jgi:HEAT repeat protein
LSPARPAPLRAAAARALGELGSPAAVPALVALLSEHEYRVAHEGAHALRRLGPAGLAALRSLIDAETAEMAASGYGAHAKPSTAAGHAREAIALAAVGPAEASTNSSTGGGTESSTESSTEVGALAVAG